MAKYVYRGKNLRCRINKVPFFIGELEFQLQNRRWFFWVNCGKWMHYSETQKIESNHINIGRNPIVLRYQYGNVHEIWEDGTMTIYERIKQLFDEYIQSLKDAKEWDQKFKSF